jgi:hypothetical protein
MEKNKKKLGQTPAFPQEPYSDTTGYYAWNGMSKRFYAACAAAGGIMANVRADPTLPIHFTNIVEDAYIIADELLRQEEL